jgi:hypothetical protein
LSERKKPSQPRLKVSLGLFDAVAVSVGVIVGGGIFVVTGIADGLILSYGKKAITTLRVKGVGPETAFRILGKMHSKKEEFYMDLLKAKIQFLKTRQSWKNKKNRKSPSFNS